MLSMATKGDGTLTAQANFNDPFKKMRAEFKWQTNTMSRVKCNLK